ncbi:methyltransferase domain-containing protein [Histophilus somni]|uniref:methyltransferase domain-containing protein n=1 Tax=Histophilus somni TaxID=731 RepID=UPI003877D6A3
MTETTQSNLQLAQAYNELPYTSKVFAACQPTRLHALAKIKGLLPPPLETAKVLEIGCSFGGNLLPFAIRHPNSQLVGIDLSEYQINIGQQMMEQVGVKNVELVAADISQVSFNIKFDYIICHGVFSWVPEAVRHAILKTIQEYLSPNGIAHISYNTYPGWKIRDVAKDLMCFGSNPNLSSLERIDQSFELLKFTSSILQRKNADLYKVLSHSFQEIPDKDKFYVAHEYFEDFNQPFYFREFISQLEAYHLAYLTDSSFPAIYSDVHFEHDEYEKVCAYFDYRLEAVEQFIDFLNNRSFRHSIITHQQNLADKGITNNISQYNHCHHFYDIYFRTDVRYSPATDDKEAHWQLLDIGAEISDTPLNNLLCTYLQEHNNPCKIGDICEYAKKFPEYDETELYKLILSIIYSNHVYLCFEPETSTGYDSKPKLFEPYRRLIDLVRHNPNVTGLSNRYYQVLNLDFLPQYIAQFLDGTRTVKDLIKQLREDIENNTIILHDENGNELSNKKIKDKDLKEVIVRQLDALKEYGYFTEYK